MRCPELPRLLVHLRPAKERDGLRGPSLPRRQSRPSPRSSHALPLSCTGHQPPPVGPAKTGPSRLPPGLQVLEKLLQQWKAQGRKALVFSQTRSMLDIIERFVALQVPFGARGCPSYTAEPGLTGPLPQGGIRTACGPDTGGGVPTLGG